MREHVEYAFTFKLAQRLANRHVADRAQLGQFVDLQSLARTKLAREDAPAQFVGDAARRRRGEQVHGASGFAGPRRVHCGSSPTSLMIFA